MKRAEQILSAAILVFAVFTGYQCTLIESGTEFGMGPAFLPFWLSVGLGIMAVAFLVRAVVLPAGQFEPAFFQDRAGAVRVLLVALVYLVAIALMRPLGIPIALAIIAAGAMPILGARNWRVVALVAVLTPLVVYVVFGRLLRVALHMGILESVLPLY